MWAFGLAASIAVTGGASIYLARRIWKKEGVGDAAKKGVRQAKSGVKSLGKMLYDKGVNKMAEKIKGKPCTWDMSIPPEWLGRKRQPEGIFYYWHDGESLVDSRKESVKMDLPEGYIASWYWMRQPPKQAHGNFQKEGVTSDGLPVYLSTNIYYALHMGNIEENKIDANLKLIWNENNLKDSGIDYAGSIENLWDIIVDFNEEEDEGEAEITEQEIVAELAPA